MSELQSTVLSSEAEVTKLVLARRNQRCISIAASQTSHAPTSSITGINLSRVMIVCVV